MTEEEFEAQAKRGSRIGGALLEVQKLANPSLKVEYLHQQDNRVEGEHAESGDDPPGSLQNKSLKTPKSKIHSRDIQRNFLRASRLTPDGIGGAKKIVEDHGGAIHLDGRREAGTLFKITIPFAIPEVIPLMSRGMARSITTP
jgi:hypothetical protein